MLVRSTLRYGFGSTFKKVQDEFDDGWILQDEPMNQYRINEKGKEQYFKKYFCLSKVVYQVLQVLDRQMQQGLGQDSFCCI